MIEPDCAPRQRIEWLYAAALGLVVLAGALLRFSHADWDGGQHFHPDERSILFVAQELHLPDNPGDVFAPDRSPLNPFHTPEGEARPYAYGHLPLYATVAVQRLVALAAPPAGPDARFQQLTYAGRAFAALADTLTILATALLARRLSGGRWAGLLAAVFTALAVLHIQNAHFGTVDSSLALLATLAVWLMVRYADTRQRRDSLLAGLCAGLAVGCKITGGLLVIPLLAAHVSVIPDPAGKRPRLHLADPAAFWQTFLAAALAFALTNPYALLDPGPFLSATVTQMHMGAGGLDWPFTRQYAGSVPVLYHVEQQARWMLGLSLTLASYTGLIGASWQAVRSSRRFQIVALVWAWAFLLVVGSQYVKFPRYMLPLTPTLFALAAGLFTGNSFPNPGLKQALALAVVVLPTALYALAFTQMYAQPHPWLATSEWVYANVPAGEIIVVELWDDPLPLDTGPGADARQRDLIYELRTVDPFAEPDDSAKLHALATTLADADYLILSSNRLYGTIPRLEARYPLTGAYYRALFAGELGYVLAASFARYPVLFGRVLVDDPLQRPGLDSPPGYIYPPGLNLGPADESFTVYDHPLVLVFRNEGQQSARSLEIAVRTRVRSQP